MDWRHRIADSITRPVARFLARTPLTPNALTLLGLVITLGAAALVVSRHFIWAGVVLLLAGAFDALDGALARETGQESRFGAVLDSTLDRVSEGALLLAVLFILAQQGSPWGVVLAGSAIIASFLVSYIRARAEAVGLVCSEGWFTRTERVLLLALGLMLDQLIITLAVVAGLSLLTAAQRLWVVWQKAPAGKTK